MKTLKFLSVWALFILLTKAHVAVAGQIDARDVPANAEVVGHVDLDALKSSSFASEFASELVDAKSELDKELKKNNIPLSASDFFKASSLTFWAEGDDTEKGALIVRGVDATKIAKAMRKHPQYKKLRKDLHQIDDAYVGVSGSRLVFADDKSSVEATLKVLAGSTKSLAQTKKAARITKQTGVLIIAAFEEAIAKKIKKEANSAIFKNVTLKRGTVTVAEKDKKLVAKAILETANTAGADQLHKLAAGAISFFSVASDNADLGKLLDGISIKTSGKTVIFKFSLPIDQIKDIAKALGK